MVKVVNEDVVDMTHDSISTAGSHGIANYWDITSSSSSMIVDLSNDSQNIEVPNIVVDSLTSTAATSLQSATTNIDDEITNQNNDASVPIPIVPEASAPMLLFDEEVRQCNSFYHLLIWDSSLPWKQLSSIMFSINLIYVIIFWYLSKYCIAEVMA